MPPRRELDSETIAQLVTQQLMTIIPGIVEQVNRSLNGEDPPTQPRIKNKAKAPSSKKKRKAKNRAVPVNQTPPAKRAYHGPHPQCPTCPYHHPPSIPCRVCTNCGRNGHTSNSCRNPQHPPITLQQNQACYEYGNPSHFRQQYPMIYHNNTISTATTIVSTTTTSTATTTTTATITEQLEVKYSTTTQTQSQYNVDVEE